MSSRAQLTTLPEALAELEQAALLLLLSAQEGTAHNVARERLASAVVMVQSARGLVIELTEATGRPPLHVLVGRLSSADALSGA